MAVGRKVRGGIGIALPIASDVEGYRSILASVMRFYSQSNKEICHPGGRAKHLGYKLPCLLSQCG